MTARGDNPCLIIGGAAPADFDVRAYCAQLGGAMTIACGDGLGVFYRAGKLCPDIFVGRSDQPDADTAAYYAGKEQMLQRAPEQSVSTATTAFQIANEAGCDPIVMIGFAD